MNRLLSLSALALSALTLFTLPAHAGILVSAGAATSGMIDANGTPGSVMTLDSSFENLTPAPGAVFTQDFTFTSGYDGVAGPVDFTITDPFNVEGYQFNYTIQGVMNVSPTADPDVISILSSPMTIGGVTFSVESFSFADAPPFPGGVTGGELTFAQTPEPNSLMLLGTGLVGVAGAARRRFRAQR